MAAQHTITMTGLQSNPLEVEGQLAKVVLTVTEEPFTKMNPADGLGARPEAFPTENV